MLLKTEKPPGQRYSISITRPRRRDGSDGVYDGIVAENAIGSSGLPACRTAHAVDVVCPRVVKHATSHVAHLAIWVTCRFSGPRITDRIIFKRMNQIVTYSVHAAPAHDVKLPVGREINADQTDSGTWKIRPWEPIYSRWVSPWRWCSGLPLAQCERDSVDRQKHVDRASNQMRSNRGVNPPVSLAIAR